MTYDALPVYLLAFLFLVVIYFVVGYQNETDAYPYSTRLFRYIILANIGLLAYDFLQISVDGLPGGYARLFNIMASFMVYVLPPILTISWLNYLIYFIHKDKTMLKKWNFWLFLTLVPYLVLAVWSMFGDVLFSVSATNVYQRGPLYWVFVLYVFAHFFLGIAITILFRKKIRRRHLLPLLIFPLPTVIGGLLQALFYGLLLAWPLTALSVFLLYVFIQIEKANIDYLTNLYNKRGFDGYLAMTARTLFKNQTLAGVIADLDHLKSINDQYGHNVGDEALKATAVLLRKSFGVDAMIARIGGDEFGILFPCNNPNDLKGKLDCFARVMNEFNTKRSGPYELHISCGADLYSEEKDASPQDFIKRLDEKMYVNKLK